MIPRTFPSSAASNGSAQMIVYFLGSVAGLTRWIDYIPVKYSTEITASKENTYDQNGYIPVIELSSITGATPFKEYVPVYLDNSSIDEDVWKTKSTGFIPIGTAGAGGASLNLDFTAGILDSRVTFTRSTTGTRTNSLGLLETVAINMPRFDYDPVTLAPKGLLIEEQRTNLLLRSEEFDNASWTKQNCSVQTNATPSPSGAVDADKLVENAGTGQKFSSQNITGLTANSAYTTTCYVKFPAANRRFAFTITDASGGGTQYAGVQLLPDGSTVALDTGFTNRVFDAVAVGNGWYRLRISVTISTVTTVAVRVVLLDSAGTQNYTGDGVSGIFIWGAQLEAGAFATSYIPTGASQVTRAADSASMIGNNFARWYTQGVGTIFSQFDTPASGNRPVVSIDDNTANNMIRLRTEATDPYFRVVTGGAAQADLDVGTVAANTIYKMAGGFGSNSFLSCINAGTVGSDTSGTVPTVDRLRIGSDQAGAYLNGHIARTTYYGRVLTATEDQGITQ